MTGKRLMIVLSGVAIVLALGLALMVLEPVSSATYNETSTFANVTVSVVIDASVSNVPIDFGTLNPGVNNQAPSSGGWPTNVTVHANTNTNWNLTMKASGDFTGPSTIPIANLDYGNDSATVATDMTTSYASPFSNWVSQADPSSDDVRSIYFDLSIPAGTSAGSYSTTLYLNVTQAQ